MRKGLIGLLIVLTLLLTGCKNEGEEVNTFFEYDYQEIEHCEDCAGTREEFESFEDDYYELIKSYDIYSSIYRDIELPLLQEDVMTSRDTLPIEDSIGSSDDIYIYTAYERPGIFWSEMSMLLYFCEDIGVCTSHPLVDGNDNSLVNLDFGFDENGGFYYFEIKNNDDETIRVHEFYYEIDENQLNYEYRMFFPLEKKLYYSYMRDCVFSEYDFLDTELVNYRHININTNRIINVSFIAGVYSFKFHDQLNNIVYKYSPSNQGYTVSYYNGLEFVISYSEINDINSIYLNFHYMNDWDALVYKTGYLENELYLNDVEVFKDYDISLIRSYLLYQRVTAYIEIEDISSYTLPSELDFDIEFSEILAEIDNMKMLENPIEILGITYSQWITDAATMYNIFTKD